MLRSAALASSVVASMPIVLPLTRLRRRQHLEDPREHRAVRLQIDQPARPRDRRVLGRRLVESQPQKPAQGQRIGGPPRNPPLRIDALEIADQQQPEVHAGRQTRAPQRRRVERRALRFDELVKPVLVENPIQPLIERMPAGGGQLVRGDPQAGCPCSVLASTHGHARHSTHVDQFWRMIYSESTLATMVWTPPGSDAT